MILFTRLHDSVWGSAQRGTKKLGESMSSSSRASSGRDERIGRSSSAPPPLAPLYKRLPHGPHRLDRRQVVRHQRARIYGAMVEAVASSGYQETSVKQVVALAGVSRRSFYEQFANKEECFLATFDLLAGRGVKQLSKAYMRAGGGLEDRMRAAMGELAATAHLHRKASVLVMVEAQTAGAAGLARMHRASSTCEQLLARSFAQSPEASPLPAPIVRGIAGGLHGAVAMRLREGTIASRPELAEEMLRWTLLFQTPAVEQMAQRVAARLAERMREAAERNGAQRSRAPQQDERKRLLHNALRLAVAQSYTDVSAPQIAEEAGVPIDTFFELFDDKEDCFLAALDMMGDELLGIAAHPDLVSDDWPRAVRRVIAELMRYLADHPLYAQTIAREAFTAGPQAVERNLELAEGIATLLTEGAPGEAQSKLAVEGVRGAIWHLVRCQVASQRIQLLPALSDYLSYVVLAPFIGADAAVEVMTEDKDID
jgi:TetR/AcrR family transcriptional regulator